MVEIEKEISEEQAQNILGGVKYELGKNAFEQFDQMQNQDEITLNDQQEEQIADNSILEETNYEEDQMIDENTSRSR